MWRRRKCGQIGRFKAARCQIPRLPRPAYVGPPDWDALIEFAPDQTENFELLRDAGYTVAWGYRFKDINIGSSNFILAYDDDAAQNGGYVAFMDGAVINVTADEIAQRLETQKDIKPAE